MAISEGLKQSVTHTHTHKHTDRHAHLRHVKETWLNTSNRPELFKQSEGEERRRWRRKGCST